MRNYRTKPLLLYQIKMLISSLHIACGTIDKKLSLLERMKEKI